MILTRLCWGQKAGITRAFEVLGCWKAGRALIFCTQSLCSSAGTSPSSITRPLHGIGELSKALQMWEPRTKALSCNVFAELLCVSLHNRGARACSTDRPKFVLEKERAIRFGWQILKMAWGAEVYLELGGVAEHGRGCREGGIFTRSTGQAQVWQRQRHFRVRPLGGDQS